MVNTRQLLFWLVLSLAVSLGAQTVAEDVVKGQEIQGIEFRSYIGPHKVIESRAAIQGIGNDLGRQMLVEGAKAADYGRKYRILRLHDPAAELLSADLFILEPGAGVDHIRNLNWILSAYLQQAFGYSVADADLLANFITRYNAFYRGQLDYLRRSYIPRVAENVTAENAGLALSYAEWPGKTRMFIPLRDSLSKGLGGSLNTEELSNQDIVTQMAQEPGGGIEERKKLADLKEVEIVQEQKAIAQAEARATAPTSPGTTPASPTSSPAKDSPSQTPQAVPSAPTAATASTPPASTPATSGQEELPLAEAKKDLAARDEALQAERKDLVQQENQTPATVPAPTPVAKPANTAAFVRMSEAKLGQLWLIDPVKNTVWKKSELNSVRQVEVVAFGPGYLVIAGDSAAANGAVRLVLLSKDDAKILITGADDILPETPLLVVGSQVFALTKETGGWVLASFDTGLKALVKGTDLLSPLTALVPTASGILVQSAAGGVMLLDAATLKKKTNTEG